MSIFFKKHGFCMMSFQGSLPLTPKGANHFTYHFTLSFWSLFFYSAVAPELFLAKRQLWTLIGKAVYASMGRVNAKKSAEAWVTGSPAGEGKDRKGERAAVNADWRGLERQWPGVISTFPAKVISPSHRHSGHTLAFVSAQVSFGVREVCVDLWEKG